MPAVPIADQVCSLDVGETTSDDLITTKDLNLKPSPGGIRAEEPADSSTCDNLVKGALHRDRMRPRP